MRLFCRESHDKPRDYHAELEEAKARLAKLEQLPESDFTIRHATGMFIIQHGVNQKRKVIARAKGDIAELGVLSRGSVMTGQDWYDRYEEAMRGRVIPYVTSGNEEAISVVLAVCNEAAKKAAGIE